MARKVTNWLDARWSVAVAVAVMVTVAALTRPVADNDSFWHVLIGYDITRQHRFTGDPAWNFGPHLSWTTTQWASEVLMAAAHWIAGWNGLIALTLIGGLVILTQTYRLITTIHNSPARSAAALLLFTGVAMAVAIDVQERPATISYIFFLALATRLWDTYRTGRWPRIWTVGLFTLTWAQFHGYWVLVAACIALTACARLADTHPFPVTRPAIKAAATSLRTPIVLAVVATAAGVVTPAGTYGLIAPIVFKQAAAPYIEEWQPSTITLPATVILCTMVIAMAGLWATRRGPRPTRGMLLVTVVWLLFGLLAYRNLIVAVLALIPVVAASLPAPRVTPIGLEPQHARRSRFTQTVTVAVLAATTGWALIAVAAPNPVTDTAPTRLYQHLTSQPGTLRVLNDYDIAGQIMVFTPERVKVLVDGRSDRYGPTHLDPYFDLLNTRPGWETRLTGYQPTHILIRTRLPLASHLTEPNGWCKQATEGPYTLWVGC